MLIRAEKRRRDESKNIRGWYLMDNEWKKSTGTDFESEYCFSLMRVSIDFKRKNKSRVQMNCVTTIN